MKLVIASDHAGYDLKETIKETYNQHEWLDLGTDSKESCDYPDYAHALAKSIQNGDAKLGVLVCGSGIGISIAANRHEDVRSALCFNTTMARLSRQHNDANVLALGSRTTGHEVALDCVQAFLETEFKGGRHQRRVNKIEVE